MFLSTNKPLSKDVKYSECTFNRWSQVKVPENRPEVQFFTGLWLNNEFILVISGRRCLVDGGGSSRSSHSHPSSSLCGQRGGDGPGHSFFRGPGENVEDEEETLRLKRRRKKSRQDRERRFDLNSTKLREDASAPRTGASHSGHT